MVPLTNISYPKGEKVRLESAVDKGSDMIHAWTTNGKTYDLETPEVVFDNTGKTTDEFFLFVAC